MRSMVIERRSSRETASFANSMVGLRWLQNGKGMNTNSDNFFIFEFEDYQEEAIANSGLM